MSKLLENIKESEGFRPRVYQCTEGFDTIGYGFAVKDLHLDEDIASMILERKVAELKLRIHREFEFLADMPECVQDVVIEMCYQMGISGFCKFKKTIAFLRLREFNSASVEMLDSKWYRQTPNRAKKLSDIVKYAE